MQKKQEHPVFVGEPDALYQVGYFKLIELWYVVSND